MDKNSGTCYYRNPASGYCPKSGVEREESDPACGCYAEFKSCWICDTQSTKGSWNYREPNKESESCIDKLIFKKMETKVCSRCGREMPLESFPTSKNAKDGHLSVCKECNSKARSAARPKREKAQKSAKITQNEAGIAQNEAGIAQEELKIEPVALPCLDGVPSQLLVDTLRERGYEVTCKRTIVEEL